MYTVTSAEGQLIQIPGRLKLLCLHPERGLTPKEKNLHPPPFSKDPFFKREILKGMSSLVFCEKAENITNFHLMIYLEDVNPRLAEQIKIPQPVLIVSQSDYLIQIGDINSHTEWQTGQIQISWLLKKKPTDLDVLCLQRQNISGFSRTRVKVIKNM